MFRIFLVALIAATAAGCRHDRPSSPSARVAPRPDETLVRVHWLGKSALSSNTNAAYLLSIWNLREAVKFEQHLVDKLASIPLQLDTLQTNLTATNRAVLLWRPLFQDLVYNETFVDFRQTKAGGIEGGIALRLSPERAASWQTNLAAAFRSTAGAAEVPGKSAAWTLKTRWGQYHASLTSVQEWTVLRFGPGANPATYFTALVQREPALQASGTNAWLRVNADLPALGVKLRLPIGTNALPRIRLSTSSDGEYVRTAAKLSFDHPLGLQIEPWTIPTNIIRNPLLSFTAVRGFRPLLAQLPVLRDMPSSSLPNQCFLWALRGGTILSFAAIPMTNSEAVLDQFGPALAEAFNPFLTNHVQGKILYDSTNHSVTWRAVPVFAPGFQSVTSNIGEVILGKIALMPPPTSGESFPTGLLQILEQGTNTVFYDWEITENRLADLYANLQAARLAVRKPTLPADHAQIELLKSIGTKLGNAATVARQTGPSELSYERKSHSGLSALEWHLLIDWVASPHFPFGLHTTAAADQMARIREQMRQREASATNNLSSPR